MSRNKDANKLNVLGKVDPEDTPMPTPTKATPPAMEIDSKNTYTALVETTEGTMTIELYADKTPKTVNNFVALARKGYYDDTIFHRVIKGFMIQGGDPKGDGTGGPGYQFEDESFDGEYSRGTVAMANAGPNTNGSQFFIVHEDALSLPKNYVIFGKVTERLDTLDAIAEAPVTTSRSGEKSKPVKPVTVTKITITEDKAAVEPTATETPVPETPTPAGDTPTPTQTPTP
jgi:cyclophilin family peptidyl-prolyl cis-trans isomerase